MADEADDTAWNAEIITEGRFAGWTWGDWTDLTLERMRWKLDLDKRHKHLDKWHRNVIFACLKEAKAKGRAYRIEGKRWRQVKDILAVPCVVEDVIE